MGSSLIRSRHHPYACARRLEPDPEGSSRRAPPRTIALSQDTNDQISSLFTPSPSIYNPSPSTSSPVKRVMLRSAAGASVDIHSLRKLKTTTPSALKLVQHAVKILTEIWPYEHIPVVLRATQPANGVGSITNHLMRSPTRSIEKTEPSPQGNTSSSSTTPDLPLHSLPVRPGMFLRDQPHRVGMALDPSLLPLKNFVYYVLRYSKTTCNVLSAALCYVEAIRDTVPRILELEMGLQGPSPLLCPQRTFVAALVVASKFLQDHCVSNRVWAKMCGFEARELSRCERALCEVLGWRLWVGKGYRPSESRM